MHKPLKPRCRFCRQAGHNAATCPTADKRRFAALQLAEAIRKYDQLYPGNGAMEIPAEDWKRFVELAKLSS